MSGRHIRLMICDDNEGVRRALVDMLARKDDLEVAGEAASAEELLELVRGETPDVVLLDVNLPGLSGLDGIASLRESGYENPVVVMSADRHHEAEAERAGAAGFFYKGTADAAELLAGIRAAVSP